MPSWSTALPDWERRLLNGLPMVPDLPLFRSEADRALRVFKRLRIPDVIGTPTMAEAAGDWFLAIVEAMFGAYDPSTDRRMIQEFFLAIPKKNAKALELGTLVATPTGFVSIRDLRVGDEVLGDDGLPTRVVDKSPVFINHQCYEVEFSTGETVVCDAGHLWVTDAHRDRDRKRPAALRRAAGEKGGQPAPSVKTTEQIAGSLKVVSGRYTINNHRTRLCKPLELVDADLPISPYVLGAWLGDGTSVQATITSSSNDADHMVRVLVANGQPAYIRPSSYSTTNKVISLGVANTRNVRLPYRFATEARKLGLYGNKHIPQTYLRASARQRLCLLQGLMDTDGTISAGGQASFTTTNERLRAGFCELVNSLGMKASVRETRAKLRGEDCGPAWVIQFWPFVGMPVFTLPRKLARQRPRASLQGARSTTRQIVDVRPVKSVPVQCISVANESKQFLITRSLIPTHNSSYGGAAMVVALIVNRRPEGEFLLVAPTKEIADIAFKQASGTIRVDPELEKLFHIQRHIRLITHRRTGATLQIKAADTDVITGSKALGTMIDETHVFAKRPRAAEVFVELRGALAARPDGFLFQTTTQSKEPPSGVFKAELQMARSVRDGRVSLPMLPVIYELPDRLARDGGWKDRQYWPLVNPNLGRSVDEEFLAREVMKAEDQGPQALALIASQHFNVEIGLSLMSDRWAGADFWLGRADSSITFEALLDRSECVVVGIDGGGLDDLFGLVALGRERDTKRWLLWSHAWCHTSVLVRRKSIAALLKGFAEAGELTVVDDELEDISAIVAIVAQVQDVGLLGAVAMDPAGPYGQFVDEMAKLDVTQENHLLIAVGQGYRMMNAIKTAERRLAAGMLIHSGSGLMNWCVSNLKIEPTATAIRATKQNAGDAKIDPAMAMFDAVDVMTTNPEPNVVADVFAMIG